MGGLVTLLKTIGGKLGRPGIWVPIVTLIAVAAVSGGVFLARGSSAWSDIQSWTFSIIVALVLVLVVIVVLLVRHVFREEHESRMDRGFEVASRDATPADGPDLARESGGGLLDAFARGTEMMRRSAGGAGPYQNLPWLLVLGEGDAGKSSLVRESGLVVPPDQADLIPTPGPTQHLSWWLTNEAVVLDAAGSFLEDDSEAGRERFRELLGLVRKARGNRGLQGLVVALPADRFLRATAAERTDLGERLRRRINELSVALCLDLPIYLVVTKSDRIEGFSDFTRNMSSRHAGEAFGWTNGDRRFTHAEEIVRAGFSSLRDRLEARLPATLTRPEDNEARRRLFLFSNELEALSEAVSEFARIAFAPSKFEEVSVPFLRGVYLTSAEQNGTTVAPYLERIGLADRHVPSTLNPARSQPYFLNDLFGSVILPSAPLAWRTSDLGPRSRRWVSLAGAAISLGLIGYWGVASWQQASRIGDIRRAVQALDGDTSLARLDQLRREIGDARVLTEEEASDRYGDPVLPGFGVGWALESARERGRARLVSAFKPRRELEIETRLDEIARTDKEVGFGALATVVQERRFLESREATDAPNVHLYSNGTDEPEGFELAYQAYGLWLDDTNRSALLERDDRFINRYSLDFQRLESMEDWSDNNTRQIRPVTYAPIDEGLEYRVTGIYTLDGHRNFVQPYFQAVEAILEERRERGEDVAEESQRFETLKQSYIESYLESWTRFLNHAPTGAAFGRPRRELLSAEHLSLLAEIDRNTRVGFAGRSRLPTWMQQLHRLRDDPAPEGRGYCAGLASEFEEDAELEGWEQYCVALRQWGRVVEKGRSNPMSVEGSNALAISRELPAGPTEYAVAVEIVQQLSTVEDNQPCGPRVRCEEAPQSLAALMAMPVGDGVSDILDGAITAIDARWQDVIRSYPQSGFKANQLTSFYGSGGALAQFLSGDVGAFYANGSWRSPVDRPLPVGSAYREWLRKAEGLRRNLFGQTYQPVIRTHGIDPVLENDPGLESGWGPTAARLIVRCGGEEVEVDLLRNRLWTLPEWSTQCRTVEMHIEVGQDRSSGIAVSPPWKRSGPFAVPEFLSAIQRGGINMSFDRPNVTLRARIRIEQGAELRRFRQLPIATSMRN